VNMKNPFEDEESFRDMLELEAHLARENLDTLWRIITGPPIRLNLFERKKPDDEDPAPRREIPSKTGSVRP
jgi:hypothetical protein